MSDDLDKGNRSWWDKRSMKEKCLVILPIAILVIILVYMGLVLGMGDNLPGEKPIFFENEYVKFQVPHGGHVTDKSNDTFLSLKIYQNGEQIGGLAGLYYSDNNWLIPEASYDFLTKNASEITVSNRKGYGGTLPGKNSSYIFVPTSPNHSIMLIMYQSYGKDFNVLKNSLVIKKEPPKANALLLLSWT